MKNILTIMRKELNAYFRSPIAYIVLAVFAIIFGYFFFSVVSMFVLQSMRSMQITQMTGQTMHMNVNEQVIRPLLMNVSVVCLFLVPMITMRLFAEEKRTGTIELLMTSPVSDMQVILGKFFAALVLYATMLAITMVFFTILFHYGNPDWKPMAVGYLGLLLLGGSFLAIGMMLSTLTRNQLVAGMLTFGLFLMLWVIDWVSDYSTGIVGTIANYIGMTTHLANYAKGVIDLRDTVYYISVIGLGLFLTARSVESLRWRA